MVIGLPGNPHYRNLEDGYSTRYPDEAATVQTEAILALAYEQRTANLIAAASFDAQSGYVIYGDHLKRIDHRLGLNQNEDGEHS